MFRKKEKKEELKIDYELVERIAPIGGITFKDEKYVSSGNAYSACIHVYSYPTRLTRHSTIEKIVGKYNKNIPIDTAISTYNRKIHEIEIE